MRFYMRDKKPFYHFGITYVGTRKQLVPNKKKAMKRTRTVEDWLERLDGLTLEFLEKQKHPCVRGHNGKEYDTAIDLLTKRKRDAGEVVKRYRPTHVLTHVEEEGEVACK